MLLTNELNFKVEVLNGGRAISLHLAVNLLFIKENCLHLVNEGNYAFNENTSEAVSYQQITAKINDPYRDKPLCGKPQIVQLDFECDVHTLQWEMTNFCYNDDQELATDLGINNIPYAVLNMQIFSVKQIMKKRKATGNRRIFRLPVLAVRRSASERRDPGIKRDRETAQNDAMKGVEEVQNDNLSDL